MLALWQALISFSGINRLLLPSPSEIVAVIYRSSGLLLFHASITFAEAIAGFGIGVVGGAALALASCYFPVVGRILMPYAVAIKTTPIIVLAPVMIMWLGNGYLSKIMMAATSAFFPIFVSTWVGLTSIEQEWLDLMVLHRASRWKTVLLLRIPHSLPEFFTGCRIATSLATVGAVVAEFTSSEYGIGHLIKTATYYLNMDIVFAGVFVLCAQGILFYSSVAWIHQRIVFWERAR